MKPNEMFKHWELVRSDLITTIDKFSEDELVFTPFPGSWPVGQIMLHIADCEDHWLHWLVRQQINPWIDHQLKDYPTRQTIKRVLEDARQRTITYLESLDEADLSKEYKTPEGEVFTLNWIIWHVLEHEIHHRGELSLALGLLGREGLDV